MDTTRKKKGKRRKDGGWESEVGNSSELEFFRHRIHLEKDSVRRAKDTLRKQKSNFQQRQRDLKLKHGSAAKHTLQQLYQEEKELSDMEVSLHRTKSLLGEKVIRLKHLEQSLQRATVPSEQEIAGKQDDTTLSDLSSHSASSGISSTEFATSADVGKLNLKTDSFRESSEIIQSLENLNSEIREIWEVLNKQQNSGNIAQVIPPISLVYPDFGWPFIPGNTPPFSTLHPIPTLADRLQNYRQHAALVSHGAQNMVVTQPPGAAQGAAVTTTLVERTRNLRDWLRQAKIEQDGNGTGQATL